MSSINIGLTRIHIHVKEETTVDIHGEQEIQEMNVKADEIAKEEIEST